MVQMETKQTNIEFDTPNGKIYPALIAVMREVGGIGKNEKNTAQRFNFRGIDTVYNELHNLMAKHGIITLPNVLEERSEERTTKSGSTLIYRVIKIGYTFVAEDGSSASCVVVGEGMDSGDKASNKAMSVAHKYALLQTFLIPTVEKKDPDYESHELGAEQVAKEIGGLTKDQMIIAIKGNITNPSQEQKAWLDTINDRTIEEISGVYNKVVK
jgi:hypothetical protein